jgi:hypothetical protein
MCGGVVMEIQNEELYNLVEKIFKLEQEKKELELINEMLRIDVKIINDKITNWSRKGLHNFDLLKYNREEREKNIITKTKLLEFYKKTKNREVEKLLREILEEQ